MNWRRTAAKALLTCLMAMGLLLGVVGCGDRLEVAPTVPETPPEKTAPKISEVSPPEAIQQLRQALDAYHPQVRVVSPRPEEVIEDTSVTVRLSVLDLPIFQNPELGLGPHLELLLDNQPSISIYDVSEPVVFNNLSPGTHTLRIFAARPWYESFKNEGAYAQTTFHIYTRTQDNKPDKAQPLLTYNRPVNSYGAEPIMLDFYLANAPLHLVAQEKPDDDVVDWRIRVTVNGESFFLDRWEPIYLQGFDRGRNWVQIEFLDEQGNPVTNAFNNTVRLIDYEPRGYDTLSQLLRGELSAAGAMGIVDRTYKAPAPEESSPEQAAPEEIAPEELVPEEAPEQVAPEAEIPAEVAPEEAPEEIAPEETAEEAAPEQAAREIPPEETAEEVAPEQAAEQIPPEETAEVAPEVAPEQTPEQAPAKETSAAFRQGVPAIIPEETAPVQTIEPITQPVTQPEIPEVAPEQMSAGAVAKPTSEAVSPAPVVECVPPATPAEPAKSAPPAQEPAKKSIRDRIFSLFGGN